MKIEIPQNVEAIMKVINDFRYESFIVGGCVRDSLLGRKPNDWDVATNAPPEKIMGIFQEKGYKVIPTGLKHGTSTVVVEGDHYEITTYRIDGDYEDNRRPSSVEFVSTIKEDLSRRDFTINAMAYNNICGLMDFFNGKKDLQKRIIRCVGEPNKRFEEDALRILRAIRFMAQLEFDLDSETKKAIVDKSHLLKEVSYERIRDEMSKILVVHHPSKYILEMINSNLMKYIIPELYECVGFQQHNPNHDKDILTHILSVLDNTEEDLILRLSALFHDIGKPQTFTMDEKGVGHFYSHNSTSADIAEQVMKRLRFDKITIEKVRVLVKEHMSRFYGLSDKGIKRLINRVGVDNIDILIKLQVADAKGSANKDIDSLLELRNAIERILNKNEPLTKKELEINGTDLISLGIPKGKEIGTILDELMEIVLENPDLNKKDSLINMVRKKNR